MNSIVRTRPGVAMRLKWRGFRLLEELDARADPPPHLPASLHHTLSRDSLWVFVSTIGELNAIGPFLHQLAGRLPYLQLVLLTDRTIYRSAYLAQYPHAQVVEIDSRNANAALLAAVRPPKLFIVAEIPCMPADAPCRLPFGYLYAARSLGAPIALVNGWLYHYPPTCRTDAIKRRWLGRDYLRIFDLIAVQNDEIARTLIEAGASPSLVHVTGNIKFDALQCNPRPLDRTRSPKILRSLAQGDRPVIVAGCVTDQTERDVVLNAFDALRKTHRDTVLVVAPRHPENRAVMESIEVAFESRRWRSKSRTLCGDAPLADDESVLVLDTLGELRDFYAVATLTYVGRNHNVLEPLAYGKAVTTLTGWDTTYPSFPVFKLGVDSGVISASYDAAALAQRWLDELAARRTDGAALARKQALAAAGGATWRNLALLEGLLELPPMYAAPKIPC